MHLCTKILIISFKEKSIFRFDYIVGTIFAFLYLVLKVYLWKGLYGVNEGNINGITLNNMIAYSLAVGLTEGITRTSVMSDLNNSVLNGTISLNLLLPIGLKKYMFIQSVTKSIFQTIYKVIPSVLIAVLVFGFQTEIRLSNLFIYVCSVSMGTIIGFLYSFLFGSSVIWFRNSFFLNNVNNVLFSLFSGAFVPIWFFPEKLKVLSHFLPFQYIFFEPVAILVNSKSPHEIIMVLNMQPLWIIFLYGAVTFVWNRGRHKLMIQGG